MKTKKAKRFAPDMTDVELLNALLHKKSKKPLKKDRAKDEVTINKKRVEHSAIDKEVLVYPQPNN